MLHVFQKFFLDLLNIPYILISGQRLDYLVKHMLGNHILYLQLTKWLSKMGSSTFCRIMKCNTNFESCTEIGGNAIHYHLQHYRKFCFYNNMMLPYLNIIRSWMTIFLDFLPVIFFFFFDINTQEQQALSNWVSQSNFSRVGYF